MPAVPNYWENRWGSKAAPIIIEAADGAGTVTLKAPVNVFNVRWGRLKDGSTGPAGYFRFLQLLS
jgi:hypothetical protein